MRKSDSIGRSGGRLSASRAPETGSGDQGGVAPEAVAASALPDGADAERRLWHYGKAEILWSGYLFHHPRTRAHAHRAWEAGVSRAEGSRNGPVVARFPTG